MYFDKSHLSPQKFAPGPYSENPKKNIGWMKVDRLSNLIKDRNIDVAVVYVPSNALQERIFLDSRICEEGKHAKGFTWDIYPVPMWK
jgi:hypothetical protein